MTTMTLFCEGIPIVVFPWLTTQEIVALSCTCKNFQQLELPDGFWKRRVDKAAKLEPSLSEWMMFLHSPSHKSIAYYVEKTRRRWQNGAYDHAIFDGQAVPYNLRSISINWTATDDKSVDECFVFGFRTLCREEAMPLVFRIRDRKIIKSCHAMNATCSAQCVVQLCRLDDRKDVGDDSPTQRLINQNHTEIACCRTSGVGLRNSEVWKATQYELHAPAAKRIALCDGFAVIIGTDTAAAVALPQGELMGKPVPISLCTLTEHIHTDGDYVIMLQSNLLSADALECQVLRGSVEKRTLEHVITFPVFPRFRRLAPFLAPSLVSHCSQGRLFLHCGRSRHLHILCYQTGAHVGCIPVSCDGDVSLSSIDVHGHRLVCGFANSDSGYNVRVYDWQKCRRLYSIRVCCATRLPRHPHTDPTLLASSIGKVKILAWQGLLLVETSAGIEVRDLETGAERFKLSKRANRMCAHIAVCHNMLAMLFTVPVSVTGRQQNRRQYFIEAWRFDEVQDMRKLSSALQ